MGCGKNIGNESTTEEFSTCNIKVRLMVMEFFLNYYSYNGPMFILALIIDVKLSSEFSKTQYVWTFWGIFILRKSLIICCAFSCRQEVK